MNGQARVEQLFTTQTQENLSSESKSGDHPLSLLERAWSHKLQIKNRLLPITWLLAIAVLISLSQTFQAKSTQFSGIAGSQEQSISFQHPVEIIRIPVVEGEEVKEGVELLQVHRHDLASSQAIIVERIAAIKASQIDSLSTIHAELKSLRAQQQTKLAEFDIKIDKLESRYQLNQRLMQQITGNKSKDNRSIQSSPLLAELSGLKEARRHMAESVQAQIDNLVRQEDSIRPADAQLAELEKRKSELFRQAQGLRIQAQFPGSIGSVLYKPSEQVPPFRTILTLHGSSPSFIKGYIHEEVLNEIGVGQTVWIRPQNARGANVIVKGVVESLGTRMVEYPERLKRNPLVSAWGREVIILLNDTSPLLLGEKVLIQLSEPLSTGKWLKSVALNIVPSAFAAIIDQEATTQ